MHEMAKMQQQTQQEMAKMHEALQTLSRVVQESIQGNRSGSSLTLEIPQDDGMY